MNISIRLAEKKDIPEVISLMEKLGRPKVSSEARERVEKIYKRYIDRDHTFLFVAEVGEKIVGFIDAEIRDRLNQVSPDMWIPDFFVDQEFRERGVGTKLLEACEEKAKEWNCYAIRLESGFSRKEAHALYEKFEFSEDGYFFEKSL